MTALSVAAIALLFGTGAVAGAVNAVAGGGTLLTFPALLAVGLPPVAAFAWLFQRYRLHPRTMGAIYRSLGPSLPAFYRELPSARIAAWLAEISPVAADAAAPVAFDRSYFCL